MLTAAKFGAVVAVVIIVLAAAVVVPAVAASRWFGRQRLPKMYCAEALVQVL
jgi:hypothetical protein